MFADEIPVEDTSTLASYLPVFGWGLLGLLALALALVAAWKLWSKHSPGDSAALADRVRGLLVKRGRPSPDTPHEDAAPAAPEGGSPAAGAAATPEEPAATGAAPVRPLPQHDAAPEDETPPWLIKALIVIASVPTLLALPWAAYAVSQHLDVPDPIAWTLGILFDVAMVGSVLIALFVTSVSRQASAIGWLSAVAAALAIAAYTGVSGALIFATTPLISKALWGLLIIIRRQQAQRRAAHAAAEVRREAEEAAARTEREQQEAAARAAQEAADAADDAAQAARDAELSTDLTFEQQREIAEKRRQARYELELADAELALELAKSEAEHQKALAEIKRLGEQRRAEDKESARVYEQKLQLMRQIHTLQGKKPAFLSGGAGSDEDEVEVSAEITATAGFGITEPPAFGFQRPVDVRALTPEGAKVRFEELKPTQQALVKYVHTAKEPTQRGAGKKLGRDESTIRRWKKGLEELGYELPFGEK